VQKLRPVRESLDYFSRGDNEHDEIVLIDVTASLYGFSNWVDREGINHLFCEIPISIGGSIDSVKSGLSLIERGADKILVNTAAITNPQLLLDLSLKCGRQALILQVDTKKINNKYRCFTHGTRELSRWATLDWLKAAQGNGVGEVHVTSIDTEGTNDEFPIDLVELVASSTELPVILSGGINSAAQIAALRKEYNIEAFSFSSITNRLNKTVLSLRQELRLLGEEVRCV
jgi:cyclase